MTVSGVLVDSNDERWALALGSAPHDVYDMPEYVKADADRIGAESVGFLVRVDNRVFLVPLLLRGDIDGDTSCGERVRDAVSPYGYPGIVMNEAASESPGFADACLTELLNVLRSHRICTAFIRLHPLLNADLTTQLYQHLPIQSGVTVSIDLRQPEGRLWTDLRENHKRDVAEARRAGFTVEIGASSDRLSDWAAIYAETLQRLGADAAYDFGSEHMRRLLELQESNLAVALVDGEVASSYLLFERNGIVQLHIGGTRYVYAPWSPSKLLLHAAASWAKARGDFVFHLGGGVGGSPRDGLFMFKSGFSPRRHAFHTLRLVADPARYEALVRRRAETLAHPPEELLTSGFFPAYRAAHASDSGRD